jgi:prepilin-type N-terminal cleavage/methylation domain-containing protein
MRIDKKTAFTLIEVLVTLAVILILAGALVGGGKYLKTQAERQLTAGEIEIISTALEQYYEHTDPKQFPPQVSSQNDFEIVLYWNPPINTVKISRGVHPIPDLDPLTDDTGSVFWRSETAFYFLDKVSQSKAILDSLAGRMLSNKDLAGTGLQIEIPTGGTTYDWVRFVDAWGTSLNYTYQPGYSFPVITSAGPDKTFGTTDDLTSR